jgi:hypothetical protein
LITGTWGKSQPELDSVLSALIHVSSKPELSFALYENSGITDDDLVKRSPMILRIKTSVTLRSLDIHDSQYGI